MNRSVVVWTLALVVGSASGCIGQLSGEGLDQLRADEEDVPRTMRPPASKGDTPWSIVDLGPGADIFVDMDQPVEAPCEGVDCPAGSRCEPASGQCVCEPDREGPDCAPIDRCAEVSCGANASCDPASGACVCEVGFAGDPQGGCGPVNACASIACDVGALCDPGSGQCSCGPGFDDVDGQCRRQSVSPTAQRSVQEVCTRWAERERLATTLFQLDPQDACDSGTLHIEPLRDALRRTNLYRWLVGLEPVTARANMLEITQACATTLAATSTGLSHDIDENYTCYSEQAREGAGTSNLALGRNWPADSVDLYVGDRGVRSLGHRRWVFNPQMGATGFGQRDRYSCMYSFDTSNRDAEQTMVLYPAAGPFPRAALSGYWSYASSALTPSDTVDVRVVDADGQALAVRDIYRPGGNYGRLRYVAWTFDNAPPAGRYSVEITGLGNGQSHSYDVDLVDCP